jgi:hypothetical protein
MNFEKNPKTQLKPHKDLMYKSATPPQPNSIPNAGPKKITWSDEGVRPCDFFILRLRSESSHNLQINQPGC